jgi:hypothetical protein
VLVPRLQSAAEMGEDLERGMAEGFDALRAAAIAQMKQRDEVIK